MTTIEIWKQAVGCFPHVEVSNIGRVRIRARETQFFRHGKVHTQVRPAKVVSPYLNRSGYPTVAFKVGDKRPKFFVHVLVAKTFVNGYQQPLCVNHKNGKKTDNRAENLEWVTLADNTRHQWATGLVDIRGENHPSAKLSNRDVAEIRVMLASKVRIAHIARAYGVSGALIYKIGKGTKRASPPEVL